MPENTAAGKIRNQPSTGKINISPSTVPPRFTLRQGSSTSTAHFKPFPIRKHKPADPQSPARKINNTQANPAIWATGKPSLAITNPIPIPGIPIANPKRSDFQGDEPNRSQLPSTKRGASPAAATQYATKMT
ncbi:MAG: hypothetical protein QNL68_11445 [Akkermansiaceae bacterium]